MRVHGVGFIGGCRLAQTRGTDPKESETFALANNQATLRHAKMTDLRSWLKYEVGSSHRREEHR